jgi:transcriptional regulator with XRE-family HTH domain
MSIRDEFTETWEGRLAAFGKWLAELRRRTKLTQEEIARRIDRTQPLIARLEGGVLNNLTGDKIARYLDAYDCTDAEKQQGWNILCANARLDLNEIDALIQAIKTTLAIDIAPQHFDYFQSFHARRDYIYVDDQWQRLQQITTQLAVRYQSLARFSQLLLVEVAGILPHYWDYRGFYHDRITIAKAAAQIAQSANYPAVAAWLQGDALAWTYLEQFNNPKAARTAIGNALLIAANLHNTEMVALFNAFLARTYLFDTLPNISMAQHFITKALATPVDKTIQARIHFVAGEVAFEQHKFALAIDWWEKAYVGQIGIDEFALGMHNYVNLSTAYLLQGNSSEARKVLSIAQNSPHKPIRPPYEIAMLKLGKAQIASHEEDFQQASVLAHEALDLLAARNICMQYQEQIQCFLRSIPRPYR